MSYLKIQNLTKSFAEKSYLSHKDHLVLDNISLSIEQGETVAVVGESGSGKTTLGRCILRLIPTDHGKIYYNNENILDIAEKDFRKLRPKFQMIFQDPYQSLNPRQTVYTCLKEVLRKQYKISKQDVILKINKILKSVNLSNQLLNHHPKNLSGGQRQRLSIARALAVNPEFIIADEPTSSLDASLKWQIMELLMGLKGKYHLTILLISHDLSLVAQVADRIVVMKDGRIIEIASSGNLIAQPKHPYTKVLLGITKYERELNYWGGSEGEEQSLKNIGCPFYFHCNNRSNKCKKLKPELRSVKENHKVACHHPADQNQLPVDSNISDYQRVYL